MTFVLTVSAVVVVVLVVVGLLGVLIDAGAEPQDSGRRG
jgi:hypothetical protein